MQLYQLRRLHRKKYDPEKPLDSHSFDLYHLVMLVMLSLEKGKHSSNYDSNNSFASNAKYMYLIVCKCQNVMECDCII